MQARFMKERKRIIGEERGFPLKQQWFADGILCLVAFVWGATFLVVQKAIAALPPNTFNAVRFTIAAVFLLIVLLMFARKQLQQFSLPLIRAGVIIGFWLCLGYALQTVGLLYTTPSKAGFITGLCVVLVPLFSLLLLGDRVKPPAVVGVLMAAYGLYMLTLSQSLTLNPGDILVFGCAICFALQIVITGKYAPVFPPLPLAIVQLSTVAVLSWLYALLFEDWQRAFDPAVIFSSAVAWGLFITSIFATALAFLAQTAFQKHTSSTRVALIFALEPVFAALTSYLWIQEVLTSRQFIGCLLIFSGMILAELPIHAWWQAWRNKSMAREESKESA
jgi:drug/metabolite transporter (DMT)-like permease